MKLLKDWAQELPREFREALTDDVQESRNYAENMNSAINYFILDDHLKPTSSIDSEQWINLSRRYSNHEAKPFHVSWWIAKDKSSGETVEAFDMLHAIDIIQTKLHLPLSEIIYAQAKESQYDENKTGRIIVEFSDKIF